MSKQLLKETIRFLINESAVEDALKRAFKEKDPRSIRAAAKTCLGSGLPQSECNDLINNLVDQGGSLSVAKELAELLDDPENWSSYATQSPRERMIGRLNI